MGRRSKVHAVSTSSPWQHGRMLPMMLLGVVVALLRQSLRAVDVHRMAGRSLESLPWSLQAPLMDSESDLPRTVASPVQLERSGPVASKTQYETPPPPLTHRTTVETPMTEAETTPDLEATAPTHVTPSTEGAVETQLKAETAIPKAESSDEIQATMDAPPIQATETPNLENDLENLHEPSKDSSMHVISPASTSGGRFDLRLDWSNLPVQSDLAQHIRRNQTTCRPADHDNNLQPSPPRYWIHQPRRNGLGQMLHMWSQSLCNAMQTNTQVLTRGAFAWMHNSCDPDGQKVADGYRRGYSPFACYFGPGLEVLPESCPNADLPQSKEDHARIANFTTEIAFRECDDVLRQLNVTVGDFRAASTEWMFSNVQEILIEEAKKQARQAFGDEGLPDPNHLVTVHIRWGDKKKEMKLRPAKDYVKEVHKLIGRSKTKDPNYPLHIYIATEDVNAIERFEQASPKHWKIHSSGPLTKKKHGVEIRKMSKMASSRAGLTSLGALLLSMEANHYVLTTKSNWSRLINELRKNIIDPRCNGCTRMVDLIPGEW